MPYSGKLLNKQGAGVGGVEVRLVAGGPGSPDWTALPHDWEMVESGRVAHEGGVFRFLSGTTAADGSFEFRGVPPDAEVQVLYWGKGVPGGRVDRLDLRPAAERTALVVTVPAPASVAGTIDRKAFPEIDQILLSGDTRSHRATLGADGTTFTADDLPAGRYEVQVYGPYRRVEGLFHGVLTNDVLARRPLTLKEGERATVAVQAPPP